MVERVRENDIFLADQGGDGRAVRGEAGLEGDGCFHFFESGHALFELKMQGHRAGDAAHRARTNAITLHCFCRSLHEAGVVCQTKVVIRAKIQHFFSVHHQPGALRRIERADAVVKTGVFESFQFVINPGEFISHAFLCFSSGELS